MTLNRAQEFLRTRHQAYKQVFKPESVYTERVLEDLAKFCRADESTFHPDARVEGIMQGRREVWLRLHHHLKLSEDELFALYKPKGE